MAERYKVKQGETIARIAWRNGFRTWEAVWDHPENSALRAARSSPHVLAPGDELFIPDKREREFSCATRMRHVFRLRTMTQTLNVRVRDGERPHAGCAYSLEFDGRTVRGATDDEGYVRERVPIETTRAKLRVALDPANEEIVTFDINLGHLDPLSTLSGVRQRLRSLGFPCGDGDAPLDDAMAVALRRFQASVGLEVTGALDERTRARIGQEHDRPEQ